MIFCYTAAFSEENTSSSKNELLQDRKSDKIIIPDVNIQIEDESSIPISNRKDNLLKDSLLDFGKIDREELSKTRSSEKFKTEMAEERRKENFTVSDFKIYYGRYENFLAGVNIGKNVGSFNYLLTYLRNKRASVGYNDEKYYNTELEVDDLNADFIYSLSTNMDLNASVGYYVRNVGLYTNASNISENKINIPSRLAWLYHLSLNSILKLEGDFNQLQLSHKTYAGYDAKNLWDLSGALNFESNWSRDNFLKIGAKYTYNSYHNDTFHFGQFTLSDKFPLFNFLAIQAGAELNLYSYKDVFWYPMLVAFYQYSDVINLRAGITGRQENISTERLLPENQIDYQFCDPEERWILFFAANYSPWKWIILKGMLSYNDYHHYAAYAYRSDNNLYVFSSLTNVNTLEAEFSIEMIAFENLKLGVSYLFKLPSLNNLLFFDYNTASASVAYKYPDWGFDISTRLSYKGAVLYSDQSSFDPKWIWDAEVSQAITKEISAEIKLNNILNQKDFVRPSSPEGGFVFSLGVRVLL
jgi:hypothetical protein